MAATHTARRPIGSHPAARWVAAYAWLLLVTVAVFWRSWENPFIKDDYQWVVDAREVAADPGRLLQPYADNPEFRIRPFQRALIALAYPVAGKTPAGYHAIALVLHACAATLFFALLRALVGERFPATRRRDAFLFPIVGATLFAAAAGHSVAVLWISALSTIQVTIVALALALFVLRSKGRLTWPGLLLLSVGLLVGLFTKRTLATFPIMLGALLWSARPGPPRRWMYTTIAVLLLIAAAHTWAARWLERDSLIPGLDPNTVGALSLATSLPLNLAGTVLGCFVTAGTYHRGPFASIPYSYVALAAVIILIACLRFISYRREIALGLLWMMVTAIPTSLFRYEQYTSQQLTVNRYYYTPMVGACIVVTFLLMWWFDGARRRRWMVALAAVAGIAWFGWQMRQIAEKNTWFRNYGRVSQSIIDWTLESAPRTVLRGGVIYAVDWAEPEGLLRAASRLYFEEHGYRLAGLAEYQRLDASRGGDGVPRYELAYDATGRKLALVALPPMRLRQ
jgi:hypothetical protein